MQSDPPPLFTPRPYAVIGCLSAILLLGLSLRITGLSWGLPGQGRFYHGISGHPDEQSALYGVGQLNWSRRQFYPTDPNVTIKGTLQTYTLAVAIGLASPWLHLTSDSAYYRANPKELDKIYRVGRWVSVVQSLLAVLALFFLAKACFGPMVALATALLLAIAPVHVLNAHYISTDNAFVLYLILMALACHVILSGGGARAYWVAGLLCGLLTATKYNAATAGLILICSHFLNPNRSWKLLLQAFAAALIGLVLGCPILVLGWDDFRRAMTHSMSINLHNGPDLFPGADGYVPRNGLRFYLWDAPLFGLGWPLWAACLMGLGYGLKKAPRVIWSWMPWWLLFGASLFLSHWRLVRWTMPLHPFLFVFAAWLWWETYQRFRKSALLGGALLVAFTLSQTSLNLQAMTRPDQRDLASDWIAANVPPGSTIGVPTPPYFWDPALVQYFYSHPGEMPEDLKALDYKIVVLNEEVEKLEKERPRYVVMQDFSAGVYVLDPATQGRQPYGRFFAAIFDSPRYERVATFTKRVRLGSLDWYGKGRRYPHDWRYIFLTVYVFKDRQVS